jgi:transposase-like protein
MPGRPDHATSLLHWQQAWAAYAEPDASMRSVARALGLRLASVQHYLRKGPPRHRNGKPAYGGGYQPGTARLVQRRLAELDAPRTFRRELDHLTADDFGPDGVTNK